MGLQNDMRSGSGICRERRGGHGKTALHALQRSQLGPWILLLLREIATVTQVSHFLDKFTKQVFPKFAYIVYCYQL